MTAPRRLVSNTAVVIAGSVLQRLLSFATTILLVRGMGSTQFGIYAFVGAYMFIFSFLVDMGFERVIAREIARQPERVGVLLGTGLIIRAGLSVVAAGAAIALAWCLPLPPLTRWCIVLAAVGMPLSLEILVRSFFQSRFEMHFSYLLGLPGSLAFLVALVVIIRMGGDLIAVFAAALLTGVMTVALMLWFALPRMRVVWRLDPQLMRYLWRESWELGIVILICLIALRLDQLLLYWLRGAAELAQYAVAVKVTEALNLIPESIMVTLFPLLVSTELSAPQRFRRIYELTVRYLVVLVLPLAFLMTLERDLVVRTLFGAGYASGANALVILAWWMFFSYTGAVYLGLMIVRSQQRLMAIVSVTALAVNLTLNVLWIPRWGATGAAAANFASSAVSFALFCLAPDSGRMMRVCYMEAVRPLVAIVLTAVIVLPIPSAEWRAVVVVPVYAVLVWLVGAVGQKDWHFARQLWQPARAER